MKNTILIILILLIIAIPFTAWGYAAIQEQQTAKIEAETQRARVQIESDNAKFIRDIAWAMFLFMLVSASLQNGVIFFLAWHGVGLGAQVKKMAEKTRMLMRRAK